MKYNLSHVEFVQHLISVGWTKEQAEQEWKDIQSDEESSE